MVRCNICALPLALSGFLCAWLLSSVLAAQEATGADRPRIVEPTFRFADTVSPAEIRHVFRLTNPGTAPLRVTRVRATCGCTTAGVEPETIPPGSEGTLEVVFKTGNRTGMQRKHVFVSTDHPEASLLQCTVEGTLLPPLPQVASQNSPKPAVSNEPVMPQVLPDPPDGRHRRPEDRQVAPSPVAAVLRPDFRCDPSALLFGTVAAGKPAERSLLLASRDGQPFRVLSCRSTVAGLAVAVQPVDDKHLAWRLDATLRAAAPTPRLRGHLVVKTDVSDQPVRILVSAMVADD